MKIHSDALERLVDAVLRAHGARPDEARLVTQNLVEANLVGHDSHGVARVPRYVEAIRSGQINVNAQVRALSDGPSNLVLDGDWGFGQVAAARAVDVLVEKASGHAVACGTVHNTNDVGRLGAYTMRAAERGFLAIMTVNDGGAGPHIAPWGATSPLFSTNPISATVPLENRPAICIDMATSVAAGSQILLALKRGQTLPPGLILDALGRPSTDPADVFATPRGSILPLGAPVAGHKGLALNLLVDVLAGALSGAGCSGSSDRDAQGVFLMLLNIEAFTPREQFTQRVLGLIEAIKSAPRAVGTPPIRIPGEQAAIEKQKRLKEGVEVDQTTWEQISAIAEERKIRRD